MSYDITLNDPVTKEPIQLDTPHQMQGGYIRGRRHNGGMAEHYLELRRLVLQSRCVCPYAGRKQGHPHHLRYERGTKHPGPPEGHKDVGEPDRGHKR